MGTTDEASTAVSLQIDICQSKNTPRPVIKQSWILESKVFQRDFFPSLSLAV
jgi:hypothetical protein